MHTMSRLLFGLAFLLVFAIGCQKNPTPVRATKNAAGKCDPELLKKMDAVKKLKAEIEGLQKSGQDANKLSSQISTKSAECKAIVDTYGQGKLESLDCTAADGKTKITTVEVKGLCGAEMAKPGTPSNPSDVSKIRMFCSDAITAKLQELINLDGKVAEANKIQKQEDKIKKQNELIKENVAICKELYPKMPDECKAELTVGDKKETRGFTIQQVKSNCDEAVKANKERNKIEEGLPERNNGTVDRSGRPDPNADADRQIVLQKTRERDEAAQRLADAENALKEKKAAKKTADAAALAAKQESDAAPTDEAKKKAAADKAQLASDADAEVKKAEKAVEELRTALQGADAALKRAKGEAARETAMKINVELVGTFKSKIEKVQVVSIENLKKIAPTDEEESKKARDTTAIIVDGTIVTYKQFREKAEKGEKVVGCRAILLPSEVKNGEAEVLETSDEGTTDKHQVINLMLKSKEGDAAFTVRCAKTSATEQMTVEEIQAALKGTITLTKKAGSPPLAEPPPAGERPPANPQGGAPTPPPARPAGPVVTDVKALFQGKVLKIALSSFIVTTQDELLEDPSKSKAIISGLPITGTTPQNRLPITTSAGATNYQAGKTICLLTGRGSKIAEKDLENTELKHRVVSAVNIKDQTQNVMRIQTAAFSTAAADERDYEKAAGAKFTCFKKGDAAITLEDLKQGLQGAVNSIN